MTLLAILAAALVQPLWPTDRIPDFQPRQIAAMKDVVLAGGFRPDEHRMPFVEWYDAPVSNRTDACMILISGGGYMDCCNPDLVAEWHRDLNALGIRCVNLVYRTPRPVGIPFYQSAWEDGQRAVRLVRSQAAKFGFDPEKIGVIGISAGAHLTTLLATGSQTPAYKPVDELDKVPCHINWAITQAIAYGVTDGPNERNARGGDAVDAKLTPVFPFDAKTCPMCLFHGGADVYSPCASTQVYRQLRRMKIPAELHLMGDRPHVFSIHAKPGTAAATWFGRVAEFLRQMNFDGRLGKATERRIFTGAYTAKTEREALWKGHAVPPRAEAATNEAVITWYIPKELKTRAIQIIAPGGGYWFCNASGEGLPVAEYFNSKGMTAIVLEYRCPRPGGDLAKHTSAWQDAQRAIRMVRHEAKARGLDPRRIGLMGFSAGGHLTLMCATSARRHAYLPVKGDPIDAESCALTWACPTYPAYALTDGIDKPNAQGGNEDDAVPVPEFSFDLDTPPMCFQHGDSDGWAAMNSVKIWEKLRRMGIQGDLHTYATRGHCFQFYCADGTGSATWLDRVWEFLTAKGLNR